MTHRRKYVTVKEHGVDKIILESILKTRHLSTVGANKEGKLEVYKIEIEMTQRTEKFKCTRIGSKKEVNEAVQTA